MHSPESLFGVVLKKLCGTMLAHNPDNEFRYNFKHVIDRAKERQVDILSLNEITVNIMQVMPELSAMLAEPLSTRPFKINLVSYDAIIVLARIDENVWKVNTILNPVMHNKHEDECEGSDFERTLTVEVNSCD